jgi:hypothetical protein
MALLIVSQPRGTQVGQNKPLNRGGAQEKDD